MPQIKTQLSLLVVIMSYPIKSESWLLIWKLRLKKQENVKFDPKVSIVERRIKQKVIKQEEDIIDERTKQKMRRQEHMIKYIFCMSKLLNFIENQIIISKCCHNDEQIGNLTKRDIKIDQQTEVNNIIKQNQPIFGKWKFLHNKIIIKSLSMLKTSQNANTRKKLEDYSYCLSHNIGKGYSSTVYKGRNDITDETVAIKVIDMRMLKGQVHKSLLASEIEVLKTFKHAKNIIEVYDIYTTKNNTYIITQFCDGGDLSKFISSKRGLAQKEAIQYLRQIVDGYSEISSNRIIHRDLKPANILLKNGKIKIADFGFAMKSSESKKYSSYNVGSPIYMPPEALNDNKYSFKSDIWAIGVIFYELLTGRTPWKAKTQKQLGKQLLSVPINKLMPQNLSLTSIQFLEKTLCVNYDHRMNPEQLDSYMQRFDCIVGTTSSSHAKTAHSFLTGSTAITGTQCSIKGVHDEDDIQKRHETSLNKNTINTPKNMRRFTFLKGGAAGSIGTVAAIEQVKNCSLPKTASTIQNNRTQTTLSSQANRKQVSKQLLSQVHFCRFVFKLLQRIDSKINGQISSHLKSNMCGLIFDKLEDIVELNCLGNASCQYKKTSDYKKICQIAGQYQQKYEKQLDSSSPWEGFDVFENQISNEIKKMFQDIKSRDLEQCQQKVIILDYLITLRQLSGLLAKNDIEMFHGKSKIQAIVQGAPAKLITDDHLRAITAKLKAIKLI